MSSLFLRACRGEATPRPPLWLMRQAGRYLPEYREIRSKRSFLDLCKTPELAAEVTLQPIRRFGMDAAVIFSDILVPPAAMGIEVVFEEGEGPRLSPPVRTREDVDRLAGFAPWERTGFLGEAIRRARAELGPDRAILGFCGAPWTSGQYGSMPMPNSNLAVRLMPAYPADDSVSMPHSALVNLTVASLRRPP